MVEFGPRSKLKTLILDMDETMIHSKFYNLEPNEDLSIYEQGLQLVNGVLEFNIILDGNKE